ncbi:ParB N-terminal domain-containing protein [Bacillota bacterium Meth-B3]
MRIEIESIKVAARIRKQTTKIEELAADIQKNGLINPITVMTVDGGYQLLAGLRRLRAAQSLGWTEIEATVAAPRDAEAALFIEHSENEQREAFTFSEKMDYARLIAEIEKAKAKERMLAGKKEPDPVVGRPQGSQKGRTRDKIGPKIGLSAKQYDRAKYVADHGSQAVIDELDHGRQTIFGAYKELRSAKPRPQSETASDEFAPAPARETDLDRAIRAERELDAYKYRQHNEIYHRDSIIESLKNRVSELEAALEAAHNRIRELEGVIHGTRASL